MVAVGGGEYKGKVGGRGTEGQMKKALPASGSALLEAVAWDRYAPKSLFSGGGVGGAPCEQATAGAAKTTARTTSQRSFFIVLPSNLKTT